MLLNLSRKILVGASFFAPLFLAQSASAITFDWQFTNVSGNFGTPTDIVAGEVEFLDSEAIPNATGVAATRLEITSVTNADSTTAPFFGDGLIELNQDLVNSPLNLFSITNSFSFNASAEISDANFFVEFRRNVSSEFEKFKLENFFREEVFLEDQTVTISPTPVNFADNNSGASSLSFSLQQQNPSPTPVPFGVIPDTGLGILAGIWGISRLHKTITALH